MALFCSQLPSAILHLLHLTQRGGFFEGLPSKVSLHGLVKENRRSSTLKKKEISSDDPGRASSFLPWPLRISIYPRFLVFLEVKCFAQRNSGHIANGSNNSTIDREVMRLVAAVRHRDASLISGVFWKVLLCPPCWTLSGLKRNRTNDFDRMRPRQHTRCWTELMSVPHFSLTRES